MRLSTGYSPLLFLSLMMSCLAISGCQNTSSTRDHAQTIKPYVELNTPEWAKNAAIYQVNIRQFTPQGTFVAAEAKLDYLVGLGVDIVWLMPIHPIGEENRKGSLGSPYSVKDYYGVNPEFGSEQDLRNFINTAHAKGLKVIFDWVANHTAWDHPLRFQHPDWYDKTYDGQFRPTPWWDWSDIIDLDFNRVEVREYMADALEYWVREFDIDGYRADVAGMVPVDFWEHVRARLDAIKPVFMLAEWEARDLHANAFDMTYAWTWHEAVRHVVHNEGDLHKLFVYYSWNESAFPKAGYRMTYVENHDSNAWEGTGEGTFGEALETVFALSVVGEGMPLIYNGIEFGNKKALEFFEKDPLVWPESQHTRQRLVSSLFTLLENNSALWHGVHGATMVKIYNTNPDKVLSFVRQNEQDKVFAVFNFTSKPQEVAFSTDLAEGNYSDYLSGDAVTVTADTKLVLQPWEYKIFVK